MAIEQGHTGTGFQVVIDRRMMVDTEWAAEINHQLRMARGRGVSHCYRLGPFAMADAAADQAC